MMNPNRFDEKAVFNTARKIHDREARASYLELACADHPDVLQRLFELLRVHDEQQSFLESPPPGLDATEVSPPITEQVGDAIGPYRLLQKIGEGGMGIVYMAEQKEPVKRRVALKIIKPGMDTRQVIARFEAERQALAMMDHPNIAKVLDAGSTGSGRPYFVMELVNGLPVTKYCDEQHLTPKERLELFIPICQAVQHAHQKGIIHRDLKPSNILVAMYDNQAVPKVIDFGVAKATSQTLTQKTMFTQLGQVIGTLEYMSPEQAQRNQLDIDTRSDVYSLGVVLYELLTGETPFDRQRLRSSAFDEMLRIIREEEPSKPSTRVNSSQSLPSIAAKRRIEPARLATMIRGELDWIVLKAMEKERGRRYQTATGFAEDIQRFLRDEVVAARPRSKAYLFRKYAKRNRIAIAMATSIAASLIVGTGLALWQSHRAALDRDRALKAEYLADQRLAVVTRQRDEITAEKNKVKLEADRAQRQSAIALAVTDFLCADLLGMVDADQQVKADIIPDSEIKLRTLLDRAAENIELRFADQPAVEAWIRRTLALSYLSIGSFENALRHAEKAFKLHSETAGIDHPNTVECKLILARVYEEQGAFAEADRLYREVMDDRRNLYGEQDERTLVVVQDLVGSLTKQNRLLEAEALCDQLIETYRDKFGDTHPRTLRKMMNLANLRGGQHRYVEAEELFQKAYEGFRAEKTQDTFSGLRCRTGIALAIAAQGRQAEGETILREVIDRLNEVLGIDHPESISCTKQLAFIIDRQGRHEEAEKLLLDSEVSLMSKVGVEHASRLLIKESLAQLYSAQGRWSQAEALFREVWERRSNSLGTQHLATLDAQLNLASVLGDQAKHEESEALMRDALDLYRRTVGEEHPSTLGCSNSMAVSLIRQERYSEAEELLENILPIAKRVIGPQHEETLSMLHNYAIIKQMSGQRKEFRQINLDILKIRQQVLGDQHPDTLRSMYNLASAEKDLENYDEAEGLLRKLIALQHEALAENHPFTIQGYALLAKVLFDQGDYEQTRDLCQSFLESHRDESSTVQPATLDLMRILILSFFHTRELPRAVCTTMEWLTIRRRVYGDEHEETRESFKFLSEFLRLTEINGSVTDDEAIDSDQLVGLMEAAERHLSPQDNAALYLGWLYYRVGKYQAAIEMLEKSNDMNSKGGSEYQFYFLAMANWQLEQQDVARDWLEKAEARWSQRGAKAPQLAALRDEAMRRLGVAESVLSCR